MNVFGRSYPAAVESPKIPSLGHECEAWGIPRRMRMREAKRLFFLVHCPRGVAVVTTTLEIYIDLL